MSRYSTSGGYDDRYDNGRLAIRAHRYIGEQEGRDSREQPIARYVGENRYYPRKRSNTAYPKDSHESAEIRVARSARDPGGRTKSIFESEPRGNRKDQDSEDFPPRRRDQPSTREAKELAASASAWDGRTNVSVARGIRPRVAIQTEVAADDRTSQSRNRCDLNQRRVSDQQVHQSTDQQKMRNALVGQDSLSAHDSQDPTFSPAYDRMDKYFLPGEGISREFLIANITRYLGPDAHCVPHENREARIIFADGTRHGS